MPVLLVQPLDGPDDESCRQNTAFAGCNGIVRNNLRSVFQIPKFENPCFPKSRPLRLTLVSAVYVRADGKPCIQYSNNSRRRRLNNINDADQVALLRNHAVSDLDIGIV